MKIPYFNPVTGEKLGDIESASTTDVQLATKLAQEAFISWSKTSVKDRAWHLKKGQKWLIENMEDVAQTIHINNGKPLNEAITADVTSVLFSIKYYTKHAARFLKNKPVSIASF